MDVDVPRLMVLRAVRDAGGVLAAADELHVSSSAVSQQLSKLERETGLALVARGVNAPVRLTPVGRRLAERADAIAAELRSARRDIVQLADQQQRTVRVGAFPSALQALVIPAAAALRSSGFDVQAIDVRDETATLDSRLRSGDLDVVLIKQDSSQPPPAGIAEAVVFDDPYRVVIPSAWTTPASLTDLLERPWTGHPAGSPGRAALDRLERQEEATLRIEHECTEYPVAIALAAAGLSVSIIPQLVLSVMPHEGIRVLDFADVGARRITARRRDTAESSIAADAVLDHIRRRGGL